jgi:serine protease Do
MAGLLQMIPAGNVFAKGPAHEFVALAKKLKPAVVNISTVKINTPQKRIQRPQQNPFGNDPFQDFFNRFFDESQRRPRKERSLGSGFIISRDGYILTNNHVVSGADEIMVKLSDGREFKGVMKGADEKLDLALVKIVAKDHLPEAVLGDSDVIEVGESVLAIGNPFGLGQTVTAGIVSAKDRVIGSGPYDDYIQTDASINPGNSGGPLCNTRGEVIGINTAIVAGGQGIGFAIPINLAKAVITQLRETGKVTRGWLGVTVQPVTPELAQSFGLQKEKGALISDVTKSSPAEKAGLKSGDIIVEFDGKQILEMTDLPRLAAVTPVGKKCRVKVLRKGKMLEKTVTIERMPETVAGSSQPSSPAVQDKLGLAVSDITRELATRLGTEDMVGVVVLEVKPGGAAEESGISQGDIIKEVNGAPVANKATYDKAMAGVQKGSVVRLLVSRGGAAIFVGIKVE